MAFRKQRRLLAADDLRAWLAAWELGVDEWRAALGRLLVEIDHAHDGEPVEEGIVWAHVAVSGSIVVVTVSYRDGTDVPIIGAVLGSVTHTATVSMAREPP